MKLLKASLLNTTVIILIIWIAIAQILVDPATQQTAITIQDSKFNPTKWTTNTTIDGNAVTQTQQTFNTDNENGNIRATTDRFAAIQSASFDKVTTYHLFDETYNPATQGAITHINYQETHRLLTVSPNYVAPYIYGYFILEQDGIIYQANLSFEVNSFEWQTFAREGLNASHFTPVANPRKNVSPNFTAQGSPIRFGYARYRDRFPSSAWGVPDEEALIYEHGIANWQVTITSMDDGAKDAPTLNVSSHPSWIRFWIWL